MRNWDPLKQLVLARLREFTREPAAVFWVYGFPLVMILALGIAFRSKPVETVRVTIEQGPRAPSLLKVLEQDPRFLADIQSIDDAARLLRTSKTDVVLRSVEPPSEPSSSAPSRADQGVEYRFDPTRPGSVLARNAVDDQLQREAGRVDVVPTVDVEVSEPGSRYVDFLVPGLIGVSLMGGGMWGVGYAIVDLRIRKLLKRFLATPMKRGHFLAGMMISRLMFMVPEFVLLLVFARLAFGVVSHGGYLPLAFLILLGSVEFAGIGLLVASRASTIETVSGLMNLVMLPMWILSGVFFANDRFPAVIQPVIQALPLTPLINSMRGVMLDGASLTSLAPELAIMSAWSVITFLLALKLFRWQ